MDIFILLTIFSQVGSRHLMSPVLSFLVGANPNLQDIDGDTPLHACHLPVIADLLLAKGANASLLNHFGKTMIEQAEELENDEMVEFWQKRNSGSQS
jgi:ankyrin repeat protein